MSQPPRITIFSRLPRNLSPFRLSRYIRSRARNVGGAGLIRLVTILATILSLAALFWGGSELARGTERRAFEQSRYNDVSDGLGTTFVAQSFRSPNSNLSRLDLELGSYAGLPADGLVRLLRGDGLEGDTLYEAPLSSASWANNPFLTISFPPISASEGMSMTLVVETPGRDLRSAIGVRYTTFDALSSGTMYTDAGPSEGDLSISGYYTYDTRTLLGDTGKALTADLLLAVSLLLLIMLPGLALLSWLPTGLGRSQTFIAAPGLSALVLPVLFLLARALGLPVGGPVLWLLLAICAALLLAKAWQLRSRLALPRVLPADLLFWLLLACFTLITLIVRFVALRDAQGGMGLDAYHHTLISTLFIDKGGIPDNYEPYAPLSSFTYHFGFHALVSSVGMLAGRDTAGELTLLMPQVGQVATTLPVLSLTLFGWRVLGNRWSGLFAGALSGLVTVVPAFYVNWSRYTQGLGLALLPVVWVLFVCLLDRRVEPSPTSGSPQPVQQVASKWGTFAHSAKFMPATLSIAGLALTHYRMAVIFIAFAILYLLRELARTVRSTHERYAPLLVRSGLVLLLAMGAVSPWLVNLAQNFTVQFVNRGDGSTRLYYSLQGLWSDVLSTPSTYLLLLVAALGVGWAARQRDVLPLLPAAAWLLLGIWSDPYLLPVRLPYAGYLDSNTLVQGVWVPLCILAGYGLARTLKWLLGMPLAGTSRRLWKPLLTGLFVIAALVAGLASGLRLSALVDPKPYLGVADRAALDWMRRELPADALVLANPFGFSWSKTSVQGSDAGLWIPLLAGKHSTVPPLPAYNEKLADPRYLDDLRELALGPVFRGADMPPEEWDKLEAAGVTHIFVGSRGGALDVAQLLASTRLEPLFHQDGVWVFRLL